MPAQKMWHYVCGGDDDDNPNGLGLGHYLYWPVWFKRNAYRFWLLFLEIFSQPTPIGTHPSSWTKQKQDEFLAMLDGVRAGGRLAVPNGVKVELVQAARDSGGDYNTFIGLLNGAIAKIVRTQTMTLDDGSSLAQGKVHLTVADMADKTDSDLLTESFTLGPVTWLVEWNFPGAKVPRVYRDFTRPEDLSASATRDQALATIGYRPTPDRIREVYGDGYELAPPPAPAPAAPDGPIMAFGEPRSATDAVRGILDTGWEQVIGPQVESIEKLVANARSLEEVRDRIGELALEDPDALARSLAQVLFAARVGGNAEYDADDDGNGNRP